MSILPAALVPRASARHLVYCPQAGPTLTGAASLLGLPAVKFARDGKSGDTGMSILVIKHDNFLFG